MEFDKVVNVKANMDFEFIPMPEINIEEFTKKYGNNVPKGPIKNPYVDEVARFLFGNPVIFNTIQHYISAYGTMIPVFVKDNIYRPMEFVFANLFNNFLRTILKEGDELPEWKHIVLLAIYKLEGKFYVSAGAD